MLFIERVLFFERISAQACILPCRCVLAHSLASAESAFTELYTCCVRIHLYMHILYLLFLWSVWWICTDLSDLHNKFYSQTYIVTLLSISTQHHYQFVHSIITILCTASLPIWAQHQYRFVHSLITCTDLCTASLPICAQHHYRFVHSLITDLCTASLPICAQRWHWYVLSNNTYVCTTTALL